MPLLAIALFLLNIIILLSPCYSSSSSSSSCTSSRRGPHPHAQLPSLLHTFASRIPHHHPPPSQPPHLHPLAPHLPPPPGGHPHNQNPSPRQTSPLRSSSTMHNATTVDLPPSNFTVTPAGSGPWFSFTLQPGGQQDQQRHHRQQQDDNRKQEVVVLAMQALAMLVIFILSLFGNAAVVLVIAKHRQLRTVTNAFIASLSGSDLLTALLCMPPSFASLFTRDDGWLLSDGRLCATTGLLNTCLGIVSTLTMTLISCDRYCAIVRQPHGKKIGRRRAVQLLAAVWLGSLLLAGPWYLLQVPNSWSHHPQQGNQQQQQQPRRGGFVHCMYAFHAAAPSRLGSSYGVALIGVCYLLPFALMCFCHYNICKTVRLSEVRVRPVATYAYLLRFYSEMRTATTVLIMIVFIIVCWGPYCAMGIARAAGGYTFTPGLDAAAMCMAWANGAINPLIYAARNPNISMLLGRNREDGYRTGNPIASYLSSQGRAAGGGRRGRADRLRDRYADRPHQHQGQHHHLGQQHQGLQQQGQQLLAATARAGSGVSSSSPGNGELAMWACKSPAALFCTEVPGAETLPSGASVQDTANTCL
ncbi:G-protein coupled receptor 135 [Lampetra fluviatilis]